MSFKGGALQLPTECTPDEALEHRRWLEFGLGTNAHTSGTNTSRRRRQPHNKRRFQRTKGPLACLSPLSFFTKRKMASPKGVSYCRAVRSLWSSHRLCISNQCPEQSPSRVVEKSVNSVSAFGRKAPFTPFLLLSPPNPLRWASAGTPVKASPLYTKGPLVRWKLETALQGETDCHTPRAFPTGTPVTSVTGSQ